MSNNIAGKVVDPWSAPPASDAMLLDVLARTMKGTSSQGVLANDLLWAGASTAGTTATTLL